MKNGDFLIKPGTKIRLKKINPSYRGAYPDRESAVADTEANLKKLEHFQDVLHTQTEHALLIVLQALDTGGKDGTIRHVMGAFNPLGCSVVSFKVPTAEELAHDFLWRVHPHTPGMGRISIFNRSHYEDVLVVRVHELVSKKVWSARYHQINHFERLLADRGVTIRKLYLHISKEEQKARLEARLKDPDKNWKFNPGDLADRARWDDYMEAYEDVLNKTSTDWAPWYVIPANHKWFRNLAISQILTDTMKAMDLHYPPPPEGIDKIRIKD